MDIELLKKLDISPGQFEELEKSGVDVEAAHKAIEDLAKAVGMNLSMAGLGHAMIPIIRVVRGGDYGNFPSNVYPVGKSASGFAGDPTSTFASSSQEEELKKTLKDTVERLETLEKARGQRKSVPGAPVVPVEDPAPQNEGWNAQDAIEMPVHEADEIAKSSGLWGKYFPMPATERRV